MITLLHRKDKDILELKNWRPISLLNQDYKLAAMCIASRIKTYLSNLIHNDNTGFIKGRYIGENVNRILNIMEEVEQQDIPSVMIMIEFEKSFDFLEWLFVIKTLEQLNFGPSITHRVKSLYSNSQRCVVNNGWTSESFILQRGVM